MVTYYWSSRRKTAAEELFSRTIRPADQNKSEPVPTLRIVQWVRTYLFLALSASESMREYPPHLTLHETVDKLEDPMGSYLKLRLRRPHFKSLNFGFVPTPAQRDCPSIPPGDEPATNPEVPNSTSTNTRKVRHEQRPSGNSSSEPPRTIRTLAPLIDHQGEDGRAANTTVFGLGRFRKMELTGS